MIKIIEKSACSGCHACVSACPVKCITMAADQEGFLYPEVDRGRCIACGLCETLCQSRQPLHSEGLPEAYACYTDDETRMRSSSGGVFSRIGQWILEQNGAVFGAAFDEKLQVRHICVERKEDLHRLRGSKYVQSVIGDAFLQAKTYLEQGRPVLFSGTPCQVDGLLHFLKKNYDNLYTQDVICHGAPSPLAWQEYGKEQEALFGAEADARTPPVFRSKEEGWERYHLRIAFENGKTYSRYHNEDAYCKAFLHNLSLRPSCYRCGSKGLHRNSDLTLGDFWGVEQVMPGFSDGKGVSLVLVNSEKGKMLLEAVADGMTVKKTDLLQAVRFNSSLTASAGLDAAKREEFFARLKTEPFSRLSGRLTKLPLGKRILHYPKRILRKILNGGLL